MEKQLRKLKRLNGNTPEIDASVDINKLFGYKVEIEGTTYSVYSGSGGWILVNHKNECYFISGTK